MIVENTETRRIVGVSVPGKGELLFLPAELRGEGRQAKVIPSKTKLTDEEFAACLSNRSSRKLFRLGCLKADGLRLSDLDEMDKRDAEAAAQRASEALASKALTAPQEANGEVLSAARATLDTARRELDQVRAARVEFEREREAFRASTAPPVLTDARAVLTQAEQDAETAKAKREANKGR